MNGAEVGVFKEADEVGFAGFLESGDGRGLEAEIGFEILGNLADKTLKGQFANEQFGGFLVAANLTESDSARTEAMRFLDLLQGLD